MKSAYLLTKKPDNTENATIHQPHSKSLNILTSRAVASSGSTTLQSSDSPLADSEDMPPLDPKLLDELVQLLVSDLSDAGYHIDRSPRATGIVCEKCLVDKLPLSMPHTTGSFVPFAAERLAAVLSPAIGALIAHSAIPDDSATMATAQSIRGVRESDVLPIRKLLLAAAQHTRWYGSQIRD